MADETTLTIRGNLTSDPQQFFSPKGDSVVNFNVASNARGYDRVHKEWYSKKPLIMRCAVWGEEAGQHVLNSLSKGAAVIVYGNLEPVELEGKDGAKLFGSVLKVIEVGASLKFADVEIKRSSKAEERAQQWRERKDRPRDYHESLGDEPHRPLGHPPLAN